MALGWIRPTTSFASVVTKTNSSCCHQLPDFADEFSGKVIDFATVKASLYRDLLATAPSPWEITKLL